MSPSSSPRARLLARRLTILPVLVVALAVTAAPATAGSKKSSPGKSASAKDDKKYSGGHGRKFK